MATWSTQTATREFKLESNGELRVVERLANLLQSGEFADVTIKVGEGDDVVTFKAHRLLLATASQPLNKLMTSSCEQDGMEDPNSDMTALTVKDVDPEAFQHVLKYIYTDDLEISNTSESLTLLKLSYNWGLKSLLAKTIKFLDDYLNEYEPISEELKNDLCDLTVLAEEYAPSLKEKCWSVLMKNVNDVIPCQSFLSMSKDMVRRLLTHADFSYKNQLVLFEAIRDWGMSQVLEQHLSVSNLQELIGEFLQYVDFKAIKDLDFMDTILPSQLLGKADVIAFFMARGLEIPRDLSFNNNNKDLSLPFEKTCRYKRGFKLSNQEIYKEHELRFRVDKPLRLLGVGFGFLFSNTDMGITVHCQGPWETRQWSDIIQTYCRVSWEMMKTADVRLMFSEPVMIEANQCYKILVRISRMSSGTSDVEMWGGTQGMARLSAKDAEFSFLKSAVDPSKSVEDSDTENKPGMVTDLFYELLDSDASEQKPKEVTEVHQRKFAAENNTTKTSMLKERNSYNSSIKSTPPSHSSTLINRENGEILPEKLTSKFKPNNYEKENSRYSTNKYLSGQKPTELYKYNRSNERDKIGITSESADNKNTVSRSDELRSKARNSVTSYRRTISSPSNDDSTVSPWKRKSQAEEASSYYLNQKPSSIKNSNSIPLFLKPKDPPQSSSKPSWLLPSREKPVSTASILEKLSQKESTNENSNNSSYARKNRYSSSNIFDDSTVSKYSQGISRLKSKYDSKDSKDEEYIPRYGSSYKSSPYTSLKSKYDISKYEPTSLRDKRNLEDQTTSTTYRPSAHRDSLTRGVYDYTSSNPARNSVTSDSASIPSRLNYKTTPKTTDTTTKSYGSTARESSYSSDLYSRPSYNKYTGSRDSQSRFTSRPYATSNYNSNAVKDNEPTSTSYTRNSLSRIRDNKETTNTTPSTRYNSTYSKDKDKNDTSEISNSSTSRYPSVYGNKNSSTNERYNTPTSNTYSPLPSRRLGASSFKNSDSDDTYGNKSYDNKSSRSDASTYLKTARSKYDTGISNTNNLPRSSTPASKRFTTPSRTTEISQNNLTSSGRPPYTTTTSSRFGTSLYRR